MMQAEAVGRVAGKVAIVTGAGRGVGRAVAERLVAEGARVVATDLAFPGRTADTADLDGKLWLMQHDVRVAAQWDAVIAAAEQRFGPVSILVNNAGVIRWNTPMAELTEDDWQFVTDVNQKGVFLGMKHCTEALARAGGGAIVNMSSTAGFVGGAGILPYVAAKFAVRGMTKAAALELADRKIRVNSVHPGPVDTDMMDGRPEPVNQPIARKAMASEIANMVLFLASDEASYCTGAEFVVDGGRLAGPPPVRAAVPG